MWYTYDLSLLYTFANLNQCTGIINMSQFTEDSVRRAVARITPGITKQELKLLQLVSTCILDETVYSTDSLAALHEMLINELNFHKACIALKKMLTMVGILPEQVDRLPGDPNELDLDHMSFFTMIIVFIKKLGPDWKKAAEEFIDPEQSISLKNIDSPAELFRQLIKVNLIEPNDESRAQEFLNKKLKKYIGQYVMCTIIGLHDLRLIWLVYFHGSVYLHG